MKGFFASTFHEIPVLYLVEDPVSIPDQIKEVGDLKILYKDGRRIGVNFFGFPTEENGFIPLPNKDLLAKVNALLREAGEETVDVSSSGYRIAKVLHIDEHPLDEKKSIVKMSVGEKEVITSTRYKVEVGQKVVVITDRTFRFDGTYFTASVIRNIPQDVEICSPKDVGKGDVSTSPVSVEGEVGTDYFLA
ncbi:MAG: hypothetical protein SPI58_00605 [Candidatus Enteromonas sp.]|nr:hypothetical protein [Candidatus Enteromonas sp.]